MAVIADTYSYSNPEQVLVQHVDLDWKVSFDKHIIDGVVVLSIKSKDPQLKQELALDTRDLQITKVESSIDGLIYQKAAFKLGDSDSIRGQAMRISLIPHSKYVRIQYATNPTAAGLQWVDAQQTADKKYPLLYTIACPIQARDLLPIQDSPKLRITYNAKVQIDPQLLAIMSAGNNPKLKNKEGIYEFQMKNPIPAYLISLTVGNYQFKSINERTGVYAIGSLVNQAATEFSDLPQIMSATETLYGPYLWGRYDLVMMPNSFPAGGMENPMNTYLSPTVITGDKSLISIIAHELAHSWSGNLITNASWNDLWLNEGITTYLQNRIVEKMYGQTQADVEARLAFEELKKNLLYLTTEQKILNQDQYNPNPQQVFNHIPYIKGFLFIRHLEHVYGRSAIDQFIKSYIKDFSFKSITTIEFEKYLKKQLLNSDKSKEKQASVKEWLHQSEFPSNFVEPSAKILLPIVNQANAWFSNQISTEEIQTENWRGQQWSYFLNQFPEVIDIEKLKALDQRFKLSESANSAIVCKWLIIGIHNDYPPALTRLKEYLTSTGKLSLIVPIYRELKKTPAGYALALKIYSEAKINYDPMAIREIDNLLKQ